MNMNDKVKNQLDKIMEETEYDIIHKDLMATARFHKLAFDALVAVGFTQDQAIRLMAGGCMSGGGEIDLLDGLDNEP